MIASRKVVCVSRMTYPKPVAHALHTMNVAAAFASQTGDAHLVVRGLAASKEQVLRHYGVDRAALRIWSLHADCLPARIRGYYQHAYVFNSSSAGLLGLHPAFRQGRGCRKILFVNTARECQYWGRMRPYLWWLKDWVFVYEAHDIAGLDLGPESETNSSAKQTGSPGQQLGQRLQALYGFDLVLCVTQALADDMGTWSRNRLKPHVVRNGSSLPRLDSPPEVNPFGERIELGYVGTIDQYRGVDTLLMAMRLLPESYHLRLVGRVAGCAENGQYPDWLAGLMNDPVIQQKAELVPPVPIEQVAGEIDRCDILLQPASSHIYTLRYAAPLKSFDYMIRGKPIVAADVPCHRELFQEGVNARLYRHNDAEHLASTIESLAAQPQHAQGMARKAWEQSAEYPYEARARRILELVDEIWERCHPKRIS